MFRFRSLAARNQSALLDSRFKSLGSIENEGGLYSEVISISEFSILILMVVDCIVVFVVSGWWTSIAGPLCELAFDNATKCHVCQIFILHTVLVDFFKKNPFFIFAHLVYIMNF